MSHGRRRLALPRHVEHEHHRPSGQRRQIRRRPAPALPRQRNAVEQTHQPFGNGDVRIGGMLRDSPSISAGRIAQVSRLNGVRRAAMP